ncbi:MAG: cytochrome P450 [Pleurocapsa sp. MO_226.B13]|nr:cytochrome P450 [Pleurocapsa sp. MO_226.B13]
MLQQPTYSKIAKNPPSVPGYPIVGCLPQLGNKPLELFMNATRNYGDIVHLGTMAGQKLYLVAHPDYIHYILRENSQNYVKGDNFQEIRLVIGNGLAVLEGDQWKRQRRIMQPLFHRQRLSCIVEAMTSIIAEMLENWSKPDRDARIDVSQEMMKLSERMFLKALWSDDAKNETEELLEAWNVAFNFISDRLWSPIKLPLSIPTPKNKRMKQAVETLDRIAYKIIRDRRQGKTESNDMLSMLLDARDESGEGMSDRELHDEIMTMFSAGFETTGVAMAWIWYVLSQHPLVERQLHQEVTTVLNGRIPTFEDLPQLKYTKMVIKEVLRLYPGAWVFSRNSLADDEIGGYHIPANSMILLSPYLTHRLSSYWDNPEGFDPERFQSQKASDRSSRAYFPFGSGSRQCIGEALAMTEMQLVVAMISQRYRLNLVPGRIVEKKPLLTLQCSQNILMDLAPQASQL